tara:strand:- start:33 stop:200 length:168 start_codon:yes stop_codon:yes gene_type:complete
MWVRVTRQRAMAKQIADELERMIAARRIGVAMLRAGIEEHQRSMKDAEVGPFYST